MLGFPAMPTWETVKGMESVHYDAAFLTQIIEHVAHPIFVKNRAFEFVVVNRACCEMVGYSVADMIGKNDYDLFSKEEADFFRQKDAELFATGSFVEIGEEPITDAQGRKHVLATTKVPLRDSEGEVTHLIGIIHDITALKAAEEALRLSNEELEARVKERTHALAVAQEDLMRKERLAVLGRLAGGVAHQIRNPLGTIKNAAYVLQRLTAGSPNPEIRQALEMIHDEVESANQTITALLDYTRVRHAVRRTVAPHEVIELAIAGQPIGPTIAVVRELPELPLVAVDAEQVRSALLNLVRNAVEAMPNGGTLTVMCWVEEGWVVVGVTDTGSGISAEICARLFEPLVTTKPLGLGLGLVTARTLIEGQGGTLRCTSQPGEGARFEVRLPIAG